MMPLKITGKTRIVLMLADPVHHIVGTAVHNDFYASLGLDIVCIPIHAPPARLSEIVGSIRGMLNVIGVGVTIPHKVPMLGLADECTPRAARVGAVNFMRRDPDGRLIGDNIDGAGFVLGAEASGVSFAGCRVLQLGAGGAGRSIAFALADAGVAELCIANRTRDKAEALAWEIADAYPGTVVRAGDNDPTGFDAIVNTTAAGMTGVEEAPLDFQRLTRNMAVADIVMSPEMTQLLHAATERGCRTVFGKTMLDGQMAMVQRLLQI